MLIFVILFIWLIIRLSCFTSNSIERNQIATRLFFISTIIVAFLSIFQYELYLKGFTDGTGGSDMRHYYEVALGILDGRYPIFSIYRKHASAYYLWCALIEFLSPHKSVIWIKLCNILLFLHTLLSLYLILGKNGVQKRSALLAITIISIDGVFMWTVMRNLKDILLTFLIVQCILSCENYLESNKNVYNKLKLLLLSGLIGLITYRLRGFTVLIVLVITTMYVYISYKHKYARILVILTALLISGITFNYCFPPRTFLSAEVRLTKYALMKTERDEMAAILTGESPIKRLATGIIRYGLLPVPLSQTVSKMSNREQRKTRVFTCFTDNFWKAEYPFLWWLLLPFFGIAILDRELWRKRGLLALGLFAISYLLIYGYMSMSAGSERQRIPFHMLGIILSVIEMNRLGFKKSCFLYPIIAIPLWLVGGWWNFTAF